MFGEQEVFFPVMLMALPHKVQHFTLKMHTNIKLFQWKIQNFSWQTNFGTEYALPKLKSQMSEAWGINIPKNA